MESQNSQEDELDDFVVQEHDEHHIFQNMKEEDDINNDDIVGSKDTQEDELDDIEILEREDLSDDSEDESCHSKEKNKSEPRVSIDPSEVKSYLFTRTVNNLRDRIRILLSL